MTLPRKRLGLPTSVVGLQQSAGAQVVRALAGLGHGVIAVDTAPGVLAADEYEHLLSVGIAAAEPTAEALAPRRVGTASIVARVSDLRGSTSSSSR